MNSLERIRAAAAFETSDRIPVIPQVFAYTGIQNGVSIDKYVSDGELLASCQISEWKKHGYDAVFAVMDVCVETEAMGASLVFGTDTYPAVETYPCSSDIDPETLAVPDPQVDGRMPELLKAAEILRIDTRGEVLVVGSVTGPMTLAVQLLGAESALYLGIDNPDRLSALLDFTSNVAAAFGIAQLKRGVHIPLIFDPSASPEFIPPQFFREFELPRLKKICAAFKENGAEANWLHIAGNSQPILCFYKDAGADIGNFDYAVQPGDAAASAPGTCLDGNIKSYSFIACSPREIQRESAELLTYFSSRGGFILSSGCEIPPESKQENISAMVSAVKESEV